MGTTDTWFLAAGSKEVKRIYAKRLMRSVVPNGTLIRGGFVPRNKLQGYNIRRAEWHFLFMAALLLESEFRGYNIWRACRHSELFEARIYRNLSKEYSHLIPILEANPRGKVSLDTSDVVTQGLIPGSNKPYTSMKCHGHDRSPRISIVKNCKYWTKFGSYN